MEMLLCDAKDFKASKTANISLICIYFPPAWSAILCAGSAYHESFPRKHQ